MKRLCVGGIDMDGQWLEGYDTAEFVRVPRKFALHLAPVTERTPATAVNRQVDTYYRWQLQFDRVRMDLWRHESLTDHEAFMRLLAYYRPNSRTAVRGGESL